MQFKYIFKKTTRECILSLRWKSVTRQLWKDLAMGKLQLFPAQH